MSRIEEQIGAAGTPPGFWSGYAAWLRGHRRRLVLLTCVLAVVFLIGLWASATPEDPFVYADLY